MNRKIRYAIVGLGHIAQTAVLPAFKHAENSQLAALVTGNREKNRELSERYGVNAYTYDDLEEAFEKEQVDAAYIATPNILDREHTERAARAGVHVLCEKTDGQHAGRLRSHDARSRGEQCETDDCLSPALQ